MCWTNHLEPNLKSPIYWWVATFKNGVLSLVKIVYLFAINLNLPVSCCTRKNIHQILVFINCYALWAKLFVFYIFIYLIALSCFPLFIFFFIHYYGFFVGFFVLFFSFFPIIKRILTWRLSDIEDIP